MNSPMRLYQCKKYGYWYVRFARGAEKSLRTRNEEEARAIFREMEREWLRGRVIQLDQGKRVTLAEFTKNYLITRKGFSEKTERQDALALRLLAEVVGGSTALRAITAQRIEEFKTACRTRGCLPPSINSYLRHIKGALRTAEDWYKGYKCPKIKLNRIGKKRPRALRPADCTRLLAAAEDYDPCLYPFLVFSLYTGARRIEAFNLRWEHVDTMVGTARLMGKGGKERRVPLLPPVLEVLTPIRRDIGRVFQVAEHPDTITHRFQDLAKGLEINARLHDLRHSAATYMLASGTPLEVVQEILGHAHISTTMIYVDVWQEMVMDKVKMTIE